MIAVTHAAYWWFKGTGIGRVAQRTRMNGSTNSLLLAMGDVRSNANLTCFCLPTFSHALRERGRESERDNEG